MCVHFCGVLPKTCGSLGASKGDLVLFQALGYRYLGGIKGVLASNCEYWSNSGEDANISFELEILIVNVKPLLFGFVELLFHDSKIANIVCENRNSVMSDRKCLFQGSILKSAVFGHTPGIKDPQYFDLVPRGEVLNPRFIARLILLPSDVQLLSLFHKELLSFQQVLIQGSAICVSSMLGGTSVENLRDLGVVPGIEVVFEVSECGRATFLEFGDPGIAMDGLAIALDRVLFCELADICNMAVAQILQLVIPLC